MGDYYGLYVSKAVVHKKSCKEQKNTSWTFNYTKQIARCNDIDVAED